MKKGLLQYAVLVMLLVAFAWAADKSQEKPAADKAVAEESAKPMPSVDECLAESTDARCVDMLKIDSAYKDAFIAHQRRLIAEADDQRAYEAFAATVNRVKTKYKIVEDYDQQQRRFVEPPPKPPVTAVPATEKK